MKTAVMLCCLTVCAGPLRSTERLTMKVSPSMTVAPGFVRIEARVDRDASNRVVRIIAESDQFYRSSDIPLDGENGPNIAVLDLRALPTGTYQITGILVGTDGQRAAASRVLRVAPAPGAR
jgi:hypothetical protein